MDSKVFLHKDEYMLSQDSPNYSDLLDQIKSSVPHLPDLFSVTYLGDQNTKLDINSQENLETLFHLPGPTTLEVQDINEEIFKTTIHEKEEVLMNPNNLGVGMVEQIEGVKFEEILMKGQKPSFSDLGEIEAIALENAFCIQALFGATLEQAIQFVIRHPGLDQEELIELAMQFKTISQ